MTRLCFTFIICVMSVSSQAQDTPFGIVVHGGAGFIQPGRYTEAQEKAYEQALDSAVNIGYDILEQGGSGLDAVEHVIRYFESNPLFNAGIGCVLTAEGKPELDASIMDGKTRNAGGVASVNTIKHPISGARLVMEKSPHVLLFGDGAERFAHAQGADSVEPEYFITPKRREQFEKHQQKEQDERGSLDVGLAGDDGKYGTVGVAALDKQGNLAAGTSTGGTNYKQWGRVGDSPIIGAGTYADNRYAAISCTGTGEYFIRLAIAYDVTARMHYLGVPLAEAAHDIIQEVLTDLGGDGGLIAIDKDGNVVMEFNTPGMFRGYRTSTKPLHVAMYKD